MLDHEDFQNIRKLGDGMEAINKYMLSIVEKCGSNIKDISKDLLKELVERTNPEMAKKMIGHLTLETHLNQSAIEEFFKYEGWPYNDLDYSLFTRYLPSLFKVRTKEGALLWFANKHIEKAAEELIADYHETNTFDEIIDWTGHLIQEGKLVDFAYKTRFYLFKNKEMAKEFACAWVDYMNLMPENFSDDKESLKRINDVFPVFLERLEDCYEEEEEFNDNCFLMRVAHEMAETTLLESIKNFYTTYSIYLMHVTSPVYSIDDYEKLQKYLRLLTPMFKEYFVKEKENEKIHFLYSLTAVLFALSFKNPLNPKEKKDMYVLHNIIQGGYIQYIQGLSNEKVINLSMFRNVFGDTSTNQLETCLKNGERHIARGFVHNGEKTYRRMMSNEAMKNKIENALSGKDFELPLKDGMDLFTLMPIFCGNMVLMTAQKDQLDSTLGLSFHKKSYEALARFLYKKYDNPFDYNYSGMDMLVTFANYYAKYNYAAKQFDDSLTYEADLLKEAIHKVAEFACINVNYTRPYIMLLDAASVLPDEDMNAFYKLVFERGKYLFLKEKVYDDALLYSLLSFVEFCGKESGEIKKLKNDALELVISAVDKVGEEEWDEYFATAMYCYKKSDNKKFLKQVLKKMKKDNFTKEFIKWYKKEAKYFIN